MHQRPLLFEGFEYLRATRELQPKLRVIGVQPTRLFPRRQIQARFMEEVGELCSTYQVPLLSPISEDASVLSFAMRGHLWGPLSRHVLALAKSGMSTSTGALNAK